MRFELHDDYFILDGEDTVCFSTMEVINKVPKYDNRRSEFKNWTVFGEMTWRIKWRATMLCLRRIWLQRPA